MRTSRAPILGPSASMSGLSQAVALLPIWPGLRIARGDIRRVIGQRSRTNQVGKPAGATVRLTTESDILTLTLTLTLTLALGLVPGYLALFL